LTTNLTSFALLLYLLLFKPMLHSVKIMATQGNHPSRREPLMPAPNCSIVKTALTELKEILSRCQHTNTNQTPLETANVFAAIAGLEATISSIEEKSFAREDFTADMGVPIITGLTQPVIS
jgi:endonuclease IV